MVKMARVNKDQLMPLLALAGGAISILSACHFMEKIAFSMGSYYEALNIISAYNISPTTAILSLMSQSTTMTVALYVTFFMLPFSVIIFTIGAMWLFSKSHMELSAAALAITSLMTILATAIIESMINFNSYIIFLIPYIGGIIPFSVGAYLFINIHSKPGATRAARPINIDPQTPYTNIMILSNRLMSKLSGEIKILDMHFDASALENLSRLLGGNLDKYSRISVLAKRDRLGSEFIRMYNDYKTELANRGVAFELNVLNDADAAEQHERVLMDASAAYKIPPLNIINKKSEHVVSVNHKEVEARFNRLWQNSTKLENLK